jgi:hypothetical protein
LRRHSRLRGQVVRRSTSNAEIISSNLVEGSKFLFPIKEPMEEDFLGFLGIFWEKNYLNFNLKKPDVGLEPTALR